MKKNLLILEKLSLPIKYSAFTLAEVLITLGIIGIVAALTIPTLINNYQKAQTVTQYKKAFSEITQAFKLAEVDNGSMDTWDFSSAGADAAARTKLFSDTYLFPYLKTIKQCVGADTGCWKAPASLSNKYGYLTLPMPGGCQSAVAVSGYSIYFWKSTVIDAGSHVAIFVDIDGPNKGKGMLGRDVFGIKINLNGGDPTQKMGIFPMGASSIPLLSRDGLFTGCSKTDSANTAGSFCGGLIANDGWTIADDYPWN